MVVNTIESTVSYLGNIKEGIFEMEEGEYRPSSLVRIRTLEGVENLGQVDCGALLVSWSSTALVVLRMVVRMSVSI